MTTFPSRKAAIALCALCLAVSACAPAIPAKPVMLESPSQAASANRIELSGNAELRLDSGYSRKLSAGSRWQYAGRVPQGDVYRPVGTIFTIEGRQVHEAYLVIHQQQLVGFYLPGEQNYSPLSTAVPINYRGVK